MNIYLLLASIASFGTFTLHTWVGGPATAGPLLASDDLKATAKYTNYYCWHLVTIVLFGMGVCFALPLAFPGTIELAMYALVQAVSFMLWSLILILWKKQPFLRLPQWILFLVISILGTLAVLDAKGL